MFFFLKKNYAYTVRKIRYRKLRGSFEMHTRGYGGVNKFIRECESVLWWNLHLSMVSYFHLGVTHEKYKIAKSGKSMFFAVWMLVTRSLQGHFEMHTKGCSYANKFVQNHEFFIWLSVHPTMGLDSFWWSHVWTINLPNYQKSCKIQE